MNDITAIILTKNEEDNIRECIESIKDYVKRIIIVDSFSTDSTSSISNEYSVDFYQNKYEYYSQQFNWAIENTNINTKWILRIDADERFDKDLWNEIGSKIDSNITGISIQAWLYFLGKKLKFGISNKRKIMLFKYGIGYIEDIKRDAHTIVHSGNIYECKKKFTHNDCKTLSKYIDRYNKYSTFEMEDYQSQNLANTFNIHKDKKIASKRKKKYLIYYKFPKFVRAKLWYIYNYYFKLGFLDGREGQIYHFFECYWYRYLVDSKIFENMKRK